jgi:hypothetical protein
MGYTTPLLSRNLAKLSLQLDKFSASYLADALHFFEPFIKPQPGVTLPLWKTLNSLTLTSSLIRSGEDPAALNGLLQAAGNAAKRMPELRAMELYNARKHEAGAFLYLVSPESTIASWESTWKFKVSDGVKQTWRNVARQHTRHELVFAAEGLLRNYQGSIKFIHLNLATWDLVLHPLSSYDMLGSRYLTTP